MDPWLYLIFIVLFLLSGFFSGTEIALMSLPSHKIDALVKSRKFGARSLQKIKSNTDRLLIAILVGNNLVNVYTAALATQISLSLAKNSQVEEAFAVAIATGIITFLILMFGEIMPKSFASKNAEKISLVVAPFYRFLIILIFPIVWVIEKIIKIFTGQNVATRVTEEEIESFIDLGKDSGTLEDDDHERLKNTLEFSDTLVEEIMVPRVRVDALSDDMTIEQALEYYIAHTHSRIPVYHDQIDSIIGVLNIRDILRERKSGHGEKLLRELHFKKFLKVPINQPIDTLLNTFKESRQHIAIVMDEYGGVAGITTIEDIVEEVFGEIHDETDFETDEIMEKGENTYIIDSSILLDDIVDEFNLTLDNLGMNEKEFGTETVGYMITHELERFAQKGEEVCFPLYDDDRKKTGEQLCFTVLEAEESAMGKVEVSRK